MALAGAAFGAAAAGTLRPVVEIMFADFLGLVLDSLVNQSSKYWYLSNEQASVPLVIRTAVGGGARLGACHSQTPTGWLLGEPGLKLVAPATPADAFALTRDAIRDDNPWSCSSTRCSTAARASSTTRPAGSASAALRCAAAAPT